MDVSQQVQLVFSLDWWLAKPTLALRGIPRKSGYNEASIFLQLHTQLRNLLDQILSQRILQGLDLGLH